jgi:hypothetical protein
VGWDGSATDWRNGFDLAAVPQQICGASGRGTHPYTTSHLHCSRAGGATNLDSGPACGNPDVRAAHGDASCAQRDPCPTDSHTTDIGTATHGADRYAAASSASG